MFSGHAIHTAAQLAAIRDIPIESVLYQTRLICTLLYIYFTNHELNLRLENILTTCVAQLWIALIKRVKRRFQIELVG